MSERQDAKTPSKKEKRASLGVLVSWRSSVFLLIVLAPCAATFAGDMRVLTTRHYRIRTDLDPQFAEELARRMDAMYDDYSRRLDDFQPGAEQQNLLVSLFASREDYF